MQYLVQILDELISFLFGAKRKITFFPGNLNVDVPHFRIEVLTLFTIFADRRDPESEIVNLNKHNFQILQGLSPDYIIEFVYNFIPQREKPPQKLL